MIDEKTFDRLAAQTLQKLERAFTDLDDQLEADLAGDILTLEFEAGRPYIVNSHRAARQIWLSAELQAWHFTRDDITGKWIDTRDGHELWAHLALLAGQRLGRALSLVEG